MILELFFGIAIGAFGATTCFVYTDPKKRISQSNQLVFPTQPPYRTPSTIVDGQFEEGDIGNRRLMQKPIVPQIDVIAYDTFVESKIWNLRCSKCRWGTVVGTAKSPHPPYCSCDQYSKGHYHFACITCKYNAIMRTVDDKG